MKRRRKKSGFAIALPGSSRRKWARRGRAIGDFAMSLLFAVSEHIVDAGIRCAKGACSGIVAMYRKRKQKKAARKPRSVMILGDAPQPMFIPVDKTKIQKVRFNDVVGLARAKKEIRDRAMTPLQHMDKARLLKIVQGGGILLVGPPGNGKSMIAKAAANEANMVVFEITAADILKSSQEASVKRVRELFRTVRRYKRVLIIINEIEGFLRKSSSNIQQSVNSQFLNETSGFLGKNGSENVLLMVGTSNIPEIMRAALKRTGRFGEVIFVGLPPINDRRKILMNSMNEVPAMHSIDYDLLAERTRLFSGADLADGLVQKAKKEALLRSTILPKGHVMPVCMEDFMKALEDSKPSVSNEDLSKWYPDGLDYLT